MPVANYYHRNREKVLKYQREQRKKDPEKYQAREKAYKEKNRKKVLARKKAYRQENKDKILAWEQERRQKALETLAGTPPQCTYCGEKRPVCLQIDHIVDLHITGSERERHSKIYTRCINDPEKARKTYQVLCANCHCEKTALAAKGLPPWPWETLP